MLILLVVANRIRWRFDSLRRAESALSGSHDRRIVCSTSGAGRTQGPSGRVHESAQRISGDSVWAAESESGRPAL